jgi:serine/threonine-protein kinase RsbW
MTTPPDSSALGQPNDDRVIELRLPSHLGYEKVAMDAAAALASRMGFARERVEALRTAVSEAVTNAIEHGNQKNIAVQVAVLLKARRGELMVSVADQGLQVLNSERTLVQPNIQDALDGSQRGGWGIWLIRELVDEVEFRTAPSGGNQVCMMIYLER